MNNTCCKQTVTNNTCCEQNVIIYTKEMSYTIFSYTQKWNNGGAPADCIFFKYNIVFWPAMYDGIPTCDKACTFLAGPIVTKCYTGSPQFVIGQDLKCNSCESCLVIPFWFTQDVCTTLIYQNAKNQSVRCHHFCQNSQHYQLSIIIPGRRFIEIESFQHFISAHRLVSNWTLTVKIRKYGLCVCQK